MRDEILKNAEGYDETFQGLNFSLSGEEVPEGTCFKAGEKGTQKSTVNLEDVIAILKTVHDPEIPVNIYELGLIYDMQSDECGNMEVLMTLTAPNCPVAGTLPMEVAHKVASCDGVGEVSVILTWTPPWRLDMMSEDAKLALGY